MGVAPSEAGADVSVSSLEVCKAPEDVAIDASFKAEEKTSSGAALERYCGDVVDPCFEASTS